MFRDKQDGRIKVVLKPWEQVPAVKAEETARGILY